MYPISAVAAPRPTKLSGPTRRTPDDSTRQDDFDEADRPRIQSRPARGVGVLLDRSV